MAILLRGPDFRLYLDVKTVANSFTKWLADHMAGKYSESCFAWRNYLLF